jgi:ATP-binding cassette subfamily B protein
VGETFMGIRVVRAFGGERRENLDYMRGRHTVLRKELFAHRRELILWTSWGLLISSVNVVIVWYGGYLNIRGGASIGDIMAFQWYTFLLLNPVWNIVNSFSELQRSLAAMERVFEVLGMENDKPDRPDARDAPPIVDEMEFDNVSFEYREGQPVVRDFNVTVPGGSVIALVGRSGAGKTTVTDLVARFENSALSLTAACSRWCNRRSFSSTARCVKISPMVATMPRAPKSKTPPAAPTRTNSSSNCRTNTKLSSASAA